jgi:hypothetical protein
MGRSPQEKKQMSYRKDHIELSAESRHAFRKKWPKKKDRAQRAERRIARETVRRTTEGESDSLLLGATRGKAQPRKWGAMPLGEYVRDRQDTRLRRAGERVKRRNPALAGAIGKLLLCNPLDSARVRRAASWLESFLRAPSSRRKELSRSLHALFRDRPALEHRVQKWLGNKGSRRASGT